MKYALLIENRLVKEGIHLYELEVFEGDLNLIIYFLVCISEVNANHK